MDLPVSFWGWVGLIFDSYGGMFIKGAAITLSVATLSTIIGFVIGLILAIIRTIPTDGSSLLKRLGFKFINTLSTIYIEVFRGTPSIVQAMVIYYGLVSMGYNIPVFGAAVLILSINTGAYMSEFIRGGIVSVDKGQNEAACAIGMTHFQCMFYVVLPQAVRNTLPAISNELILNIKDTSVLNVISLNELFFMSKSAAGTYLKYFEVFFITGIIYLVMTFSVSKILRFFERKLDGDQVYALNDADNT